MRSVVLIVKAFGTSLVEYPARHNKLEHSHRIFL